MHGLDLGGLNAAEESSLQIGFVDVAARITGLQIGFINVADNGFLPVFPFFNFPRRRWPQHARQLRWAGRAASRLDAADGVEPGRSGGSGDWT